MDITALYYYDREHAKIHLCTYGKIDKSIIYWSNNHEENAFKDRRMFSPGSFS